MYNPYGWDIKKTEISKQDDWERWMFEKFFENFKNQKSSENQKKKNKENHLGRMAKVDSEIVTLYAEIRELEENYMDKYEEIELKIRELEDTKSKLWEEYRKLYI